MCYSLSYNAPTTLPVGGWPATSLVHYTTSCNTQSSVPEDGQNNCPKHFGLHGIINKPLMLHLVGCLYYLYQRCTVKQITDNEIYLLIKYLWRVAKRLSYIEDARCLKVNHNQWLSSSSFRSQQLTGSFLILPINFEPQKSTERPLRQIILRTVRAKCMKHTATTCPYVVTCKR